MSFVFLFTGVAEHPLLPDLDIFNLSKSKDNSMETNTGEMAATETAVVDDNAPLFYSPGKRGNYFSFKKWYFVFKIVQTYCEKNSSIDQEKLLQLIGLQSQICKIMRSLKSGFLLLQKIFPPLRGNNLRRVLA